ncbi:hypothetical protein N784_04520 [Pontibacillus litoralis JSM 072002]|uniref:Uncharacterized protein n=1 Tax=Pontibacillus litoralis JSM 072002 TaxID=1385512 RepID=A0A0A5G646_9BACI|nr:hypothetical protein N784_04520 [Pontibacillus litoralis JSM 072002]
MEQKYVGSPSQDVSAGTPGLHQGSSSLLEYLKGSLSDEYNLLHPNMPNPEKPEYVL